MVEYYYFELGFYVDELAFGSSFFSFFIPMLRWRQRAPEQAFCYSRVSFHVVGVRQSTGP